METVMAEEARMLAQFTPVSDQTLMRAVLGHYATGVTIVTSEDENGPAGFTCQSFQALSLDPALIIFCVGKSSTSWPRIRESGHFAVNVLEEGQEALCRAFAASGTDKFSSATWSTSLNGSPILDDVLAWIDCTIEAVHDGGDHDIVVGKVHDLHARDAAPLLFFQGKYRTLS
jgi:3-hydroxy-9,10-secoandrosta-1,3,5(10)-triene-9,17-dione monooxygenase reductase component